MEAFEMKPIGHVRGGREQVEDDAWGGVTSRIELDLDVVDATATEGLSDFSHLEVVFLFDRVDPDAVCRRARHPRGNTSWPKVGILAQRAKDRPNRIGLTVCEVVDVADGVIEVRGLDAVDGTPVLDIKPYVRDFAPRGDVRQPSWIDELMKDYW